MQFFFTLASNFGTLMALRTSEKLFNHPAQLDSDLYKKVLISSVFFLICVSFDKVMREIGRDKSS